MTLAVTIVDSFTNKLFSGNPAAVCILAKAISDDLMMSIAAEINLSETAFLYPENSRFRLRWFTPIAEVKLCGHATLASAHVLWEKKIVEGDSIEFYTLSGKLTAKKNTFGIELNFPIEPVEELELDPSLLKVIDTKILFTGKTENRYFIEIANSAEIYTLKPDLNQLLKFPPGRLLVTAKSDSKDYDFISRYFAPGIGIPEDPVTGSAHCALAYYWSQKLNKKEFSAYQASARGGSMKVVLSGDRVLLTGTAITVMRSELLIEI